MEKVKVGIVGPGNIGTDLMYKVLRSDYLEMAFMAGIWESPGIQRANSLGIKTTVEGIEPLLEDKAIEIVFDCTSAKAHLSHAPLIKKAGKIAIDLTPAAIGPYVVPPVNLDKLVYKSNLNMVTCGGQATIPIVAAVGQVTGVKYAEIVATIASKSAGPGTRQNIDEFTQTTAKAICNIGGSEQSKAIIILNPAEPPLIMTNTIYVQVEDMNKKLIKESVLEMVNKVQKYVPGYRLRVPPIFEDDWVTVIIEVEGRGDYLPKYAGNLDIITSAALAVGEELVIKRLKGTV